jgi:hypothetical protein
MTASAPIGISPEAMRALLEQAVREHVAIRRKAMNTTPGLVASFVAEHEALLRSLHKGNPACAQLFAPDFFLLHKNSSPTAWSTVSCVNSTRASFGGNRSIAQN